MTAPRNITHRSPFRYPGGKTWLVPVIRQWLYAPGSKHLIEPFCGGATVSLTAAAEHLADTVHMNELDPDMAAAWRTILSNPEALASKVESFIPSPKNIAEILSPGNTAKDDLTKAFATLLLNRISFGGIAAKSIGTLIKTEGRTVSERWFPHTLALRIRSIGKYSGRIRFTEGDALDILEHGNFGADTFIFLDPPYPSAGRRLYTCSKLDHERLLSAIAHLECKWLLTYEDNEDTRRMLDSYGMTYTAVPMRNAHNKTKTELLAGNDLSFLTADRLF